MVKNIYFTDLRLSRNLKKIAIIGGGAAGFFAALSVKEHHEGAQVVILEKSKKLLSKVKISGGGRCNVTNSESDISELSRAYPRGGRKLKKAFYTFNTVHTMDWFESRGVSLVIQEDGCVFPASQDSQSIIDCFIDECRRLGIEEECFLVQSVPTRIRSYRCYRLQG